MLDLTQKRSLYRIYKKRKANGKFRVICAPQGELKQEQEALAKKLDAIYKPLDCVYGYIKGRSTRDLADKHVGKDWVVTIDIENFFPSITKEMVLWLSGVTEYEAEIATLNGVCVQGSPCSPIISNMVMFMVDLTISTYCDLDDTRKLCYTRYSDDIQLSGIGKPRWKDIAFIRNVLLTQGGFKLNEKKVKFMFKNQRQEVLGICINDKLSISRKVRSQLRFREKRDMLTSSDIGMISYINGIMT